ncbi:alpha/beta hydrolase [Bradyrhizobium sp. LHD-71]|uniref:alpha/beta fold hydrolase n=1 Tax=Bradyrhizobium sp. LHD-71 TaxID=3072141 RepID=UPI00280D56D3|nr:alpha/beta hydrolase [Bradyrhizobium sp. LHD-71]MDQ8729335.1 alpha/beta hydrolase [Bradyrhizobium sp. LHD-71]
MTHKLNTTEIAVAGAKIKVLEGGQGPDLLFLHGAEGPDTYSSVYLEELAKNFRVIAPWHPGFGHSERPKSFTKVDDLAYFYLDLADHYGLKDAVLAGASFGGWIALETAVRSAARFSQLVLSAPFGFKAGGRETRDIFDLYLVGPAEWPEYFLADKSLLPDYPKRSADELMGIARSREAMTLYGWQPYMHNPVLGRWLHRIKLPTLFVWGDKDRMVSPDYGRAYAARIPGSRFELITGAGHLAHVEQPAKFRDLVLDFVGNKKSAAA